MSTVNVKVTPGISQASLEELLEIRSRSAEAASLAEQNKNIAELAADNAKASEESAKLSAQQAGQSNHEVSEVAQSIEQASQDLLSIAATVKSLPLGNGYVAQDLSAPDTSLTLDLSTGTVLRAELTAPSTVIAIDGATTEVGASRYATIILRQGSGANKVEWPDYIRWSYGNPPVLSFEQGQEDVITLMNIGGDSHWYGFLSGGWIHA